MDWPAATAIVGACAPLTAAIIKFVPRREPHANGHVENGRIYAEKSAHTALEARLTALERFHSELKADMKLEFSDLKALIRNK